MPVLPAPVATEDDISLSDNTYASLLEVGRKLVKAETGSIYIWKHGRFYRVYTNTPAELLVNPRQGGLCEVAFITREPCITPREEIIRINPQLVKTNIQCRIYIPLSFGNKAVGVMTFRLYRRKKILTARELETLKMLGSIGCLMIQHQRLEQDLKTEQKMHDSLLNITAHELRTPLTSMNVYLQLLHKKKRDLEDLHLIHKLEKASKDLAHVVDQIISVDSIKNEEIHFSWDVVDLRDIIEKAYAVVKKDYPQRNVTVRISSRVGKALIKADTKKLQSVFVQILTNAIKFSPKDKEVMCKVTYKNPHYIVTIEDSGIGFTQRDANKIFKAFFKGENNFKDGMGLGLFLSRKIVQYHRGFILIKSKKNKGTKVKIYLPEVI